MAGTVLTPVGTKTGVRSQVVNDACISFESSQCKTGITEFVEIDDSVSEGYCAGSMDADKTKLDEVDR